MGRLIRGTAPQLQVGQQFNPAGLFTGLFIPNALARSTDFTATEKIVYGRLLQYAGANGQAYPMQTTLAEEVGLSKRQIIDVVQALEDKGLIIREKAQGQDRYMHKSNRYRFLWHEVFAEAVTVDNGGDPQVRSTAPRDVLQTAPPTEENRLLRDGAVSTPPANAGRFVTNAAKTTLTGKPLQTPPPTSDEFKKVFLATWHEHHPGKYIFQGAKDGAVIKKLHTLLKGNVRQFRAAAVHYMADKSHFYAGHPAAKLLADINKFVNGGGDGEPGDGTCAVAPKPRPRAGGGAAAVPAPKLEYTRPLAEAWANEP